MSVDGGDCETVIEPSLPGPASTSMPWLHRLQDEGAKSFVNSWNDLMAVIASKSATLAKAS